MEEVTVLTCKKLIEAVAALKETLESNSALLISVYDEGDIGIKLVKMLATVDAMNAQLEEHFEGVSEGG